MTQQRIHIDGHEHFACELCGDWTRTEFREMVDTASGERECCPGCVGEIERELRDEALAGEQQAPLWISERWT